MNEKYDIPDMPLADSRTWFNIKLARIIALVTQRQRRIQVIDMQSLVAQELQVFDEMKLMFDSESYSLSRREALFTLASLPLGWFRRSKVLMGLAHAYAQTGKKYETEALNTIRKARDVFAGDGDRDEVPVFLSADDGLFALTLFEGWVHLDLGRQTSNESYYQDAAKALARIEEFPSSFSIPERIRIEITNRQAQAAIGQGDLGGYMHYTEQGAAGLKMFSRRKRHDELIANYTAARRRWPTESKVLELADLLVSLR